MNVNSYTAESIEVLNGLDPVKRRPGMYTDTLRPNHLGQEAIDNSVDEAIAGFANRIDVVLYEDNSLEVTDNGRGMGKAAQQRVFDPGFSTKASGWGMGLALVRRIVEEYHRGQVDLVRSVEGEGTTFRIRIPAV